MDLKKTVSIVLTSTLLLSILLTAIPKVYAQTTVEFVPLVQEVHTLMETFTLSCMINDVVDLAGFDLKIFWDTAYLEYVSHTVTLACLNAPTTIPVNLYNSTEGSYRLAAASLNTGDLGFDGSGEAFTITLRAINVPFGPIGDYFDTSIHFTIDDLADSAAVPIDHTTTDGIVRIYYREFVYPPEPLLKVLPETYGASAVGDNFDFSVWLMGNGETPLDAFWDVAGIDVYMNFDPTLMQVVGVDIDPDGEFESKWPNGLYMLIGWNGTANVGYEIDNVAGTVRVAYMGIPGPNGVHTIATGEINMFAVTFTAIVDSTTFPPPSTPITLENPTAYVGFYVFDSNGVLIDPTDPVGTVWTELVDDFGAGPFEITDWADLDEDGELGPDDEVTLMGPGGFYYDYGIDYVTGTLTLEQQPFHAPLWAGFAMDGPVNAYTPEPKLWTTGASGDGYGVAYKTGNFSLTYPVTSIASFDVYPQFGAPYSLTEGVDFVINPDGTVELITPLDEYVMNEYVGNMTMVYDEGMAGWPGLGGVGNWYTKVASSFESIWIDMHNGTQRYALNLGYYEGPPSEYWYDDWFPYEIESYWATGYYAGPWVWPDATDIYINYTAPAWVEIDYYAPPDPDVRYVEFDGDYAGFLTSRVSPTGSVYNEAYPITWRDPYTIVGWTDTEPDGELTVGDFIDTINDEGPRTYLVLEISTDIGAGRKPWICEIDPSHKYFGWAPIVSIAGFPQPDADYCPWHNADYSVPLPHFVENAVYTAPYRPLGGYIDLFVCNFDDPVLKGVGKDQPADMRWPQKELCLCANVTYAGWPEQNKDVAFEIKFPNGTVYVVMYGRTNENGTACVTVRLPWPCDDPEALIGNMKWKVWATVDVACIVVNDTLEFKYDYRVRIWDAVPNKTEYKHCEDIIVEIFYGTLSMQVFNITFTLTVTDASGVPIGFDYAEVPVGGAQWCTYANGSVTLSVHVVKWARPVVGTIYVGALSDFPQNGGSAETPVFITTVGILAEWA